MFGYLYSPEPRSPRPCATGRFILTDGSDACKRSRRSATVRWSVRCRSMPKLWIWLQVLVLLFVLAGMVIAIVRLA
jgi:hypothetical protein